jgi:hypothetical protein
VPFSTATTVEMIAKKQQKKKKHREMAGHGMGWKDVLLLSTSSPDLVLHVTCDKGSHFLCSVSHTVSKSKFRHQFEVLSRGEQKSKTIHQYEVPLGIITTNDSWT